MDQAKKGLPDNAYTPLEKGEEYIPVIPASQTIAEITNRSVIAGVMMAILFSFAAAYLGMKVGQVFEAAIPIAILAVGMSVLYKKRKNTLLENVIIQSIGAASGAIVAGGIFVIPALYILDLNPSLLNTFIVTALGGALGILFLIPLRKYFCVDEHGNLPFPEATATTEILVTGETGGSQAKVLVVSMLIGGIYDFIAEVVHLWDKHLSSAKLLLGLGEKLADKAKMVLKIDALAALLGLGYIIGIKYSSIIVGGSILSYLVMIPAFYFLGQHVPDIIYPGKMLISQMDEVVIFDTYVRPIGIGAIACAGIIGILKNGKVIISSFSVGFREIFKGRNQTIDKTKRTQLDLSMKTIILGSILTAVLILVFFITLTYIKISFVSLVIILILCFLFTMVAARAIAIVGVNPVSGMTLVTLIISSVILVNIGLSGTPGMIVALLVGAVVCTSLSMSGAFITDLKIGYWLGATPRNQERYKFLGVIVSALSVSLAILLINEAFGFVLPSGVINPEVPAPQGNLMAAIISSLMAKQPVPWLLYGLGVIIAIMLEMVGVPPLAFALGMYLPIQLNVPLIIGGFLAWLVGKSSKNNEVSKLRKEHGTLIASGFIAGGALMGVLGAALHLDQIGTPVRFISVGIKYVQEAGRWMRGAEAGWFVDYGQWISLAAFIGLCLYVYFDSKREVKQ